MTGGKVTSSETIARTARIEAGRNTRRGRVPPWRITAVEEGHVVKEPYVVGVTAKVAIELELGARREYGDQKYRESLRV